MSTIELVLTAEEGRALLKAIGVRISDIEQRREDPEIDKRETKILLGIEHDISKQLR